MSSRALRRLQQQQEETEVSEPEEEYTTKAFNAFDLLNEEEEEEEENEERVEEKLQKEDIDVAKEQSTSTASAKPKKSKKSKKKKSKKKKESPVDSDEELDRILREAQQKDKSTPTPVAETPELEYDFELEYNEDIKPAVYFDSNFKNFTTERLKQSLPFLNIGNAKNLDPDQELRNLFGELSEETIADANNTSALAISPEVLAQFKKLARLTRGWSGKDRKSVPGTTRKLLLTRIKDDYLPTAQKPLNMDELTDEDITKLFSYKEDEILEEELRTKIAKEQRLGVRYFKFNKILTAQDRVANTRFYASTVLTPDPDALMNLLLQHPYHEETLLQVAMVMLRQGGDKSVSNALVERCLFVFDRSFNKRFHELLLEGKSGLVRLPYEGFVNRQFYLCVFRYIMNLGERQMFSTAFAYCKFLLALSPAEDPLGVRFFIDYYALLAEEYNFLVGLADSPLVTSYLHWNTPGIAFSVVLASLKLGKRDLAVKQLKKAYEQYPLVASKLLESVGLTEGISGDETVYTEVAGETYLVRAPLLWKEQESRDFLVEELKKLSTTNEKTFGQSVYGYFFGKSKKQEEIPYNLIRFAILSGENKIMAKLPKQVFSRDDMFEYDVIPPRDEHADYNEFTGHSKTATVTDSLLDYVDQNVLGAIIQNQTSEDNFEEILQILQNNDLNEGEERE